LETNVLQKEAKQNKKLERKCVSKEPNCMNISVIASHGSKLSCVLKLSFDISKQILHA
jgi:ribosomal protein S27AE